ncbi:MAG TPA: hypothetical protein VND80_05455 [Steroidobacteraceae bacterium]|nr:hypothetical protein [Steroidobacteraceae bacterium]
MNSSSSIRLRALPSIALLAGDGASATHVTAMGGAARFADAEQLIASGFAADVIVLCAKEAADARRWLQLLRRNPRLGLRPMLLSVSHGPLVDSLSDGLATSADDALRYADDLRARWQALDRPEPIDGDDRLLSFLYLHPEYVLEPVADSHDERDYCYPLADLYSLEHEDGFALISRLQQRGMLKVLRLVERLHVCPDCASAHLLFNELCPQCASIDIVEQHFLHCYACGHVAPQEEYLGRGGLICPKCSARLRHIGVDYDRALETMACKTCSGRFTEAEVKARCARCRKQYPTDALMERRFHSFRLSSAGESAARSGSVGDLFALIDEVSHAHPAYFGQTLNWLLALNRRHPEVHFSLLMLKFSNLQALAADLSRGHLARMLDTVAQRLRALLRGSDLFMRDDDGLCWLLLPQTAAAGLAVLRERIEALSAASTQNDGRRIEMAIATVTSALLDQSAGDASAVMGRLRGAFD